MVKQIVVTWKCDQQGPNCENQATKTEQFVVFGRAFQKDFCLTCLDEFRLAMELHIKGSRNLGTAPALPEPDDDGLAVTSSQPRDLPIPVRGVEWWAGKGELYTEERRKIREWGLAQKNPDGRRRFPDLKPQNGRIPVAVGFAYTREVRFGEDPEEVEEVEEPQPKPTSKARRNLAAV